MQPNNYIGLRPEPYRVPLTDETWSDIYPLAFHDRVKEILSTLEADIEGLSDAPPYPSCCYNTPAGNLHVVYCNGAVKPEGGPIKPIISGLSVDEQVESFRIAAAHTLGVVKADKPEGKWRLIMRSRPEASRALCVDGLHVSVRVRLGWDAHAAE